MITLPFGLSFADIPAACRGSASSPGRGVHRAAEASCLLQPQAPGASDVTFPAGTAGASALHAAPPPSPRPSLQSARGSPSRRSPSSVLLYAGVVLAGDRQLPPPSCCCDGFPSLSLSPSSPPRGSSAGRRSLTSKIGKSGGSTPGFCRS